MKIENIDIQATIEKTQLLIREDKQLPAAIKSMFEILILIINLLVNRLNLNSTNNSKPPASDPNRQKHSREKTGIKATGQKGHSGTTLENSISTKKPMSCWLILKTGPKMSWLQQSYLKNSYTNLFLSQYVSYFDGNILF